MHTASRALEEARATAHAALAEKLWETQPLLPGDAPAASQESLTSLGKFEPQITQALKALLGAERGLGELKEFQARAVIAILERRDVFVVAPTGAGKTLPFELAALYLHLLYGTTPIVISPRIVLMLNQADSFNERTRELLQNDGALATTTREEAYEDADVTTPAALARLEILTTARTATKSNPRTATRSSLTCKRTSQIGRGLPRTHPSRASEMEF